MQGTISCASPRHLLYLSLALALRRGRNRREAHSWSATVDFVALKTILLPRQGPGDQGYVMASLQAKGVKVLLTPSAQTLNRSKHGSQSSSSWAARPKALEGCQIPRDRRRLSVHVGGGETEELHTKQKGSLRSGELGTWGASSLLWMGLRGESSDSELKAPLASGQLRPLEATRF